MKRLIHYFAALLAMLLALAGCSGSGTGAPSAPAEELYNKQVVLAAPRDLSPGEKDGYYSSLILQVWEPLVNLGEDGAPAPALATDWQMSDELRDRKSVV